MDADSLDKLVTREMPFGKYQGRLIADLPGDYLNWFAREGFPARRDRTPAGTDARDRPQRPVGAAGAAAQTLIMSPGWRRACQACRACL
jgi:hypothetical protein